MINSLVSIIIPCFNQALYLDDALQSVLDQTYSNWECIIVNDGSPDNTESVSKKWIELDERFRYLKKENGGLSSARNAGFEASNGKYILLLDADDRFKQGFIEKAIETLDTNEEIGFVTCYAELFGVLSKISRNAKSGGLENYLMHNNNVVFSLVKREAWAAVGGFDEKLNGFEDWDFWIRILGNGWKMHVIQEPYFMYRIKQESMVVQSQNDRYQLMKYIILKNHNILAPYFQEMILLRENEIQELKKTILKLKNTTSYRVGNYIGRVISKFKRSV